MLEHAAELRRVRGAGEARRPRCDAVLLGMGGSSLGPEVIRRSLRRLPDGLASRCSTPPTRTRCSRVERSVDLDKTLFIVSSKSGGTIETLSPVQLLLRAHGRRRRALRARSRTRAGRSTSSADGVASARCSRTTRTSAAVTACCRTSASCPAALAGVEHRGACSIRRRSAEQNCAQLRLPDRTRACGSAARSASSPCTAATSSPSWSTSRSRASGCGSSSCSPSRPARRARASCRSPTSRSASPDGYGDDRVFVLPAQRGRAGRGAGREDRGARPSGPPDEHRPVLGGAADLGRIFFFAEFATAVAGWALGINPFDQPNVQEAKDNTARTEEGAAGRWTRARSRTFWRRPAAALRGDPRLRQPSDEFDKAVEDMRGRSASGRSARPRSGTGRATCTRPASSTRAARGRRFIQLVPARRRGRRDPGSRLPFEVAEARSGDRGPADAARARPAPVRVEV